MNTPVTKRVHMSAHKKNSIAKQTTLVTNAAGELLKGSADIKPGTKSTPQSAGSPEFNRAFAEAKKAGKENFEFKGKKYNTKLATKKEDTPGSANFNYEPVLTEPTKGSTVDTSTAYGVRQISRGIKKSAKDVRRASIKLSKLADFSYNEDGSINIKSIKPKDTSDPRKMAKFNERLSELESMQNTQKRISDIASSGVDPRLTSRYEFGQGMKKSTPGGEPVIDTSGKYKTQEDFEAEGRAKAGINLGNVNSKAGEGLNDNEFDNKLRENLDEKSKVTTPVSTAMSNVVSQGYSTSSMFAKKYDKPTSMLKKSGMKMGGFGSKTYKK